MRALKSAIVTACILTLQRIFVCGTGLVILTRAGPLIDVLREVSLVHPSVLCREQRFPPVVVGD
jgi:hypothetical protein